MCVMEMAGGRDVEEEDIPAPSPPLPPPYPPRTRLPAAERGEPFPSRVPFLPRARAPQLMYADTMGFCDGRGRNRYVGEL